MVVYILRHGEAIEASGATCDEWRYLNEKGRKTIRGVAKRLEGHGNTSRSVISSPLVRSVQTAQIVAETFGRTCTVEISGLLLPDGGIAELAAFLRDRKDSKNIMLVGHEPQLGQLAASLLQCEETISLKKGSCFVVDINPCKPEKPARFRSYIKAGGKTIKSLKRAFDAT